MSMFSVRYRYTGQTRSLLCRSIHAVTYWFRLSGIDHETGIHFDGESFGVVILEGGIVDDYVDSASVSLEGLLVHDPVRRVLSRALAIVPSADLIKGDVS